ncbi:MAG: SpoIIE family protein phosphatase [Myxococcota bacterium]|nr:SpoIIE family protein phosphatase [Myxococcota bacterium]
MKAPGLQLLTTNLSESELAATLDAMTDGILILDPKLTIKYINRALLEVIGQVQDVIVGEPVSTVIQTGNLYFLEGIEAAFLVGSIKDTDVSFRTSQGKLVVLSATGDKIIDPSGEHIGYVVMARNQQKLQEYMIAESRAMSKEREIAKQLEATTAELQRYYESAEEEKRLLRHLMTLMTVDPGLKDPCLKICNIPAEGFSGDLVLATRAWNNILYVMLVDATGHGLPAAINLLPITRIFYKMVKSGFSMTQILHEMNSTVGEYSPSNRFVAATLAAIDYDNKVFEIWNGGNPDTLVISKEGTILHSFKSRNMALGILNEKSFESKTEKFQWHDTAQLLMLSDGLLDALNSEGHEFTQEGLVQALANSSHENRFTEILDAVHKHCGDVKIGDDLTLILVEC